MKGIAILFLIVLAIWIFGPMVSRWLRRKANEKTEDFLRNAMGMPPRPGSRKAKRQEKENRRGAGNYYEEESHRGRYNPYGQRSYNNTGKTFVPKEYAEDVEYVETKEFSSDTVKQQTSGRQKTYHESQVSDAEWTEIK